LAGGISAIFIRRQRAKKTRRMRPAYPHHNFVYLFGNFQRQQFCRVVGGVTVTIVYTLVPLWLYEQTDNGRSRDRWTVGGGGLIIACALAVVAFACVNDARAWTDGWLLPGIASLTASGACWPLRDKWACGVLCRHQ